MSKQKDKGTRYESRYVADAQAAGLTGCRRQPLSGARDCGDVILYDAGPGALVGELKNCGAYDVPGWLRQASAECENACGWLPFASYKLRGVGLGDVGRHVTAMYNADFWRLVAYVAQLEGENAALRAQVDTLQERRLWVP
jgi:hypothetical protein